MLKLEGVVVSAVDILGGHRQCLQLEFLTENKVT